MDSLVFYLLWAVVVFVVLRFGRGAPALGDGHGQRVMPKQGLERNPKQLGWIAPKTAVDPVCGRSVQTSAAKSSVDDGAVHYFCSRECRERFEVGPHLYLGQTPDAPAKQVSHG
jgi:YHS domain-containing protein